MNKREKFQAEFAQRQNRQMKAEQAAEHWGEYCQEEGIKLDDEEEWHVFRQQFYPEFNNEVHELVAALYLNPGTAEAAARMWGD